MWLVGTGAGQLDDGYTIHWDGSLLSEVPHPFGALEGVSAVASNDVWAVGWGQTDHLFLGAFSLHWDGSEWTRVKMRNPDAVQNVAFDVSALHAGEAWTVGWFGGDDGGGAPDRRRHGNQRSLIEHWNGTDWRLADHPDPDKYANVLNAVDARTPSDVWAVGYSMSEPRDNLVEHWDGHAWQSVQSPQSPDTDGLTGVSADATDDAWAVGYSSFLNGTFGVWIQHWNGTEWTQA